METRTSKKSCPRALHDLFGGALARFGLVLSVYYCKKLFLFLRNKLEKNIIFSFIGSDSGSSNRSKKLELFEATPNWI
jgi:hypothetical protein